MAAATKRMQDALVELERAAAAAQASRRAEWGIAAAAASPWAGVWVCHTAVQSEWRRQAPPAALAAALDTSGTRGLAGPRRSPLGSNARATTIRPSCARTGSSA